MCAYLYSSPGVELWLIYCVHSVVPVIVITQVFVTATCAAKLWLYANFWLFGAEVLARDATHSVCPSVHLCVCPRQLESRVCTQHCASRATSTTALLWNMSWIPEKMCLASSQPFRYFFRCRFVWIGTMPILYLEVHRSAVRRNKQIISYKIMYTSKFT